jgi:nicotinamide-nucleotide amidase
MTPSNLRQALIPAGAEMIPNPRGTAPGFLLTRGGVEYYAMPGVPSEMKAMFQEHIAPRLRRRADVHAAVRHLRVFGYGESVVGEKLADLMARGANPDVGTQVEQSIIGVRVLARAASAEEADRLADAAADEVRRRLGQEHVFGRDGEQLEEAVARELERTGYTLAVAESCSGGALANRLTNVPGISRFFLEGVVAYSNRSKVERLGVPAGLIEQHGAVSAPVAEAMARGIRGTSGADLGVGVTGIAGPGGGSPAKPVGLVYVAVAGPAGVETRELRLTGQREDIKDRTAKNALHMVRLLLTGVKKP